jgi:hypothetical protein
MAVLIKSGHLNCAFVIMFVDVFCSVVTKLKHNFFRDIALDFKAISTKNRAISVLAFGYCSTCQTPCLRKMNQNKREQKEALEEVNFESETLLFGEDKKAQENGFV